MRVRFVEGWWVPQSNSLMVEGEGAGGGGSQTSPAPAASASAQPTSPTPSAGASSPPSPAQSADGSGTTVSGEVPDGGPPAEAGAKPFGDELDFNALNSVNDLDDFDEIEVPPAPKTVQEPAGQQPPAQAQTEQPKPPEQPKAPPAAEGAPQAQSQEGAASEPIAPANSPEGILQGLEHAETAQQLRGWLAQNVYALSEAERQALDTDAVGAIPSIMARVHLESTKNTLKLLSTLVPDLIGQGVTKALGQKAKGEEALNEFFSAWPGLKRTGEQVKLVNQYARMYRQMNPTAPRAEAIKWVGAALHAHLGIAPQQQQQPQGQSQGQQASRVVSRTPIAPAFAPARPGARPVASALPPEPGQFDGLGMDFED